MIADKRAAITGLSEGVGDFVNEPHAAIEGISAGEIVNLTDRRAANSRDAQLDLLGSLGPDGVAQRSRYSNRGPESGINATALAASNHARTP